MALGYLIPALFVSYGTACALWPRRFGARVGSPAYILSIVVNEQPFLATYYLLLSTVLAAGTIATPTGWLALCLVLLSLLGLARVVRLALSAGPVLDRALEQKLGTDWQLSQENYRVAMRWRRIIGNPFLRRLRGAQRTTNVSYGSEPWQKLDIYNQPGTGSRPVFIHLHGGHFAAGGKSRESLSLLYELTAHGWVGISANYRLSRGGSFPDNLIDVKRVIAWVRDHAAELGADPTHIFIGGSSAGAHLAATVALTANQARYQHGFEVSDTSVAGAVCFYGYYGPIDSSQSDSSPMSHVNASAPPFLIIHGSNDSLVPTQMAQAFADELRATSEQPVIYAELPGAQHVFDRFHSLRFDIVTSRTVAFLDWARQQ